ncbi:MAG: hypothetical protein ACM3ZV_07510 [Bacillota bacterium]
MTKQRSPLTFENAITTVASLIGWPEVGRICKRSERTVRNWSDPDTSAMITLDQALALDTAYITAGGDGPPFHLCYTGRLDAETLAACATQEALLSAAAKTSKETGEAVSAAIAASRPNASIGDIAIAEREHEEAIVALSASLAQLRSLRGSNSRGAAGARVGENA